MTEVCRSCGLRYQPQKQGDDGMKFGETILEYKDDILKDLDDLIRIESVSATDKESAARALEFVLDRAGQMGFKTRNIKDIAGHAEYGEGDGLAAVLAHVDVVPAGEGWSSDPYRLTERDGRYYGRGVVDDKGPAIVALYCMKALKDRNIKTRRRLRLIVGAAEEIGMNDMDIYFKNEELPDIAFTPDSDYGICCREKGIMQIEVRAKRHDGTMLTSLHGGSAVNAVPYKASALIDCTEREDNQLRRRADGRQCGFDFVYTMDGLRIAAAGKASHASIPQDGLNAVAHLIRLLADGFGRECLGSLCTFLDTEIGLETDGSALGIACTDRESGALTLNIGVADIDDNKARALIDIRYPVTKDSQAVFETIRSKAAKYGLDAEIMNHELPLSMDEDAPVIMMLREAYKSIMGVEPRIYSTGGGTYARMLKNHGVAFGPVFEGDPAKIHDADEGISVENFFLHAQICLEAMHNMVKE